MNLEGLAFAPVLLFPHHTTVRCLGITWGEVMEERRAVQVLYIKRKIWSTRGRLFQAEGMEVWRQ